MKGFCKRTLVAGLLSAIAGCGSTPARPVTGEQTFATHCASCHGAGGGGDGPVAATLKVAVPDLRTLCARSGGEFPVDRAASYIDGRAMPAAHGARSMPVWGPVFETTHEIIRGADRTEERIDALIAHLVALQSECGGAG
jgi:mono/diheme cytochrome c family protein